MNNKKIISSLLAIFFLIVISSFISAGCCEEDEDGFSCQNVIKSECKDSAKFAPTSCEYTQYCQTGTCLNIDSGTCSRNTPKTTCEEAGGTWKDKDPEEIPLCQNGCCLYGTQTAFVNQVECKQISSEENINVNFRKDISSQTECYALANSY